MGGRNKNKESEEDDDEGEKRMVLDETTHLAATPPTSVGLPVSGPCYRASVKIAQATWICTHTFGCGQFVGTQ